MPRQSQDSRLHPANLYSLQRLRSQNLAQGEDHRWENCAACMKNSCWLWDSMGANRLFVHLAENMKLNVGEECSFFMTLFCMGYITALLILRHILRCVSSSVRAPFPVSFILKFLPRFNNSFFEKLFFSILLHILSYFSYLFLLLFACYLSPGEKKNNQSLLDQNAPRMRVNYFVKIWDTNYLSFSSNNYQVVVFPCIVFEKRNYTVSPSCHPWPGNFTLVAL